MDYKPYTDLITSQHRVRSKYMRWVQLLLSLFDVDIGRKINILFETHTAVGKQLDVIGELVGADRRFPVMNPIPGYEAHLTDDIYRRMIFAKIVQNNFKGPQGDLQNLWESVFERDLIAESHDGQDMIMDVTLTGDYNPVDIELVLGGYIIPKPLGVGMRVNMTTEIQQENLMANSLTSDSAIITMHSDYSDPLPTQSNLIEASIARSFGSSSEFKLQHNGSLTYLETLRTGSIAPADAGVLEYLIPKPQTEVSICMEVISSCQSCNSAIITILSADVMN